jgi:phage terminase large subunit GpA-like protein
MTKLPKGHLDGNEIADRIVHIPDLLPCHEWAAKYRMLPSAVTAKAGLYDVGVTPWMQEPQESFDDPTVMTTVLCLASRLGKTEGILNLIGRTIHTDPSNTLMVYPTIDSAKKWAKEFLNPMFENNHVFRGLISDPAKRDGENTMLSKRFPGGRVSGIGANSPSAFRQVQARLVLFDEVDAMENSREGDPITLGMKRADNYNDSIQVISSTPTTEGESKVWHWLEQSDHRQWFVPSPFCDEWHVLAWENMRWDADNLEEATYIDPFTGDEWTEKHRQDAVMAGEWRATRPFKGVRGYQANAMISLFSAKKGFKSKYHQFASEFLAAKHAGTEELKVWTNTFLGKPWKEQVGEQVDWQVLYERREQYEIEPLPESVLLLTFAADVQKDRIEYEWCGWSDGFESYGIKYGVISGDTKRSSVWEKLQMEITREWPHAAGGSLRLSRGFIDEGYNSEQVRLFCLNLLKSGIEVYPSKGMARAGITEPELVKFNPNKRQSGIKAPTWNVGITRAKRSIYAHLLLSPPGPNTMHWPESDVSGYDERYFEMLTSERAVQKYQYGQPYTVFIKPSSSTRNEALDIRVYNYACAVSINPSWEAYRRMIDKMASREKYIEMKERDPNEEEDQPKKKAARKGFKPRNNWVNGWK